MSLCYGESKNLNFRLADNPVGIRKHVGLSQDRLINFTEADLGSGLGIADNEARLERRETT